MKKLALLALLLLATPAFAQEAEKSPEEVFTGTKVSVNFVETKLADVLGLTRQTAVFAFTCGDGLSNLVIPTSGVLMAMIGLAKVPFERWLRFVFPLFLQLSAVAAIFLAIAVAIQL